MEGSISNNNARMGWFFGIDIDVTVNFKQVQTYVNRILAKLELLRMK
jgi:hypothetical protein